MRFYNICLIICTVTLFSLSSAQNRRHPRRKGVGSKSKSEEGTNTNIKKEDGSLTEPAVSTNKSIGKGDKSISKLEKDTNRSIGRGDKLAPKLEEDTSISIEKVDRSSSKPAEKKLSDSQIEALTELYNSMTNDGKRALTVNDLKLVFASINLEKTDADYDFMMTILDSNTGKTGLEKFLSIFEEKSQDENDQQEGTSENTDLYNEEHYDKFSAISNGRKFITRQDIREAMVTTRMKLSEKHLDKLFHLAHKNPNDNLYFKDFKKIADYV